MRWQPLDPTRRLCQNHLLLARSDGRFCFPGNEVFTGAGRSSFLERSPVFDLLHFSPDAHCSRAWGGPTSAAHSPTAIHEANDLMMKTFVPAGKLSAKKREFRSIVADIRHAVFSVVRQRPVGNGQFQTSPLGSGFFVSPLVFVTCWHVIDDPKNAHKAEDRYTLINNLDGNNYVVYDITGGVGQDIHLFPDLDFAIILCRAAKPDQPYLPIGYACLPVGAEIGVAGYPLPAIKVDANGTADITGLVYRVARGTATGVYRTNWDSGDGHPLVNTLVVEVNFWKGDASASDFVKSSARPGKSSTRRGAGPGLLSTSSPRTTVSPSMISSPITTSTTMRMGKTTTMAVQRIVPGTVE
jgi:hypothetical protein